MRRASYYIGAAVGTPLFVHLIGLVEDIGSTVYGASYVYAIVMFIIAVLCLLLDF